MRNIIITGGNGLLATELARHLTATGNTNVYLVSRSPHDIHPADRVKVVGLSQLATDYELRNLRYDALVHTAFSRSSDGVELKKSLDYLAETLEVAGSLNLGSFVNISSQSVYGVSHSEDESCDETTPISPHDNYAIAKAFSEVMVNSWWRDGSVRHTNLRLASILSYKESKRFVNVFVDNAKHRRDICIYGGDQRYSFIDIEDASRAIVAMLNHCEVEWQPVYNLGSGNSHSLLQIATAVADVARRECGIDVNVKVLPPTKHANMILNIARFSNDFSWSPRCGLESSIEKLFKNQ